VIFTVSEKPSIGRINFKGNNKIKADDLSKESGIKLYSIYNPNEVKQSVNKLKDYYRQEGYYTVEITDKVEEIPRNEVALTYEIIEGEKIYIQKIEFIGNTKFKSGKLKDVMDTSEKGLFSWFTKSGLLDKKRLETDAQKITVFYQNQGYLRAKVGEPTVRYESGYGLVITIEIVEGDQTMGSTQLHVSHVGEVNRRRGPCHRDCLKRRGGRCHGVAYVARRAAPLVRAPARRLAWVATDGGLPVAGSNG
jgi:outer membrane protein insertion porin family